MGLVFSKMRFSTHQTYFFVDDLSKDEECLRTFMIFLFIGNSKDLFLVFPVDFDLKTTLPDISKQELYLAKIIVRAFHRWK